VRILHISSARNFGGGEKHLVDLAKGLTAKGHDVFIAVRPSADWRKEISFLPEDNIFGVPLRNSLDIFSGRKLAQIVRENNIEIVHAHLARDYTLASLAVRFAPQTKFVLTRHVLFPLSSLHKFTLTNISKAVAVSDAVKIQLEKVIPAEKIIRIYNGIETAKFSRADQEKLRRAFRFENNIPFDAPLIAAIGELKFLKGQRDFILAAQVIAQKFPEARFLIVGRDNSLKRDFRRELKRLVKIFGLDDRFLWLDWVEDTATVLPALDVFVSASHSESFGLAILEAMADGVPVVATATEGAKELLGSSDLIPVENPARIAEAVCNLLTDKKSADESRRAAQLRAEELFDIERMICETEETYENL
jgi:glycosyltransferase involved in cell wall biosynthesis